MHWRVWCGRTLLLAGLGCGPLASNAQPPSPAALRQVAADFLKEPAVSGAELGDLAAGTGQDSPDAERREWLVYRVGQAGTVAVHRRLGRVVSYQTADSAADGGSPRTPDELAKLARAFAEQHAPEVFAGGGEVVVEVNRGPRQLSFTYQRTRQGFWLPTRAEVALGLGSGRVDRWQADLRDRPPTAERLVGLDEAKAAVAGQLALEGYEAVTQWLQARGEFASVDEHGQRVERPIYRLFAEVQSLTLADRQRLGRLGEWWVDAATGAIKVTRLGRFDARQYAWYLSVGGQHEAPWLRLTPRLDFIDGGPLVSPDGRSVALYTSRPRPGWSPRRQYVVVVRVADGRARWAGAMVQPFRCFEWSPDSRWLLGSHPQGLMIYEPESGRSHLLGTATVAGWLDDGRLAVFGAGGLQAVDPLGGKPPVPLPALPAAGPPWCLLRDPRGGLLATTDKPTVTLWRLPPGDGAVWTRVTGDLNTVAIRAWSAKAVLMDPQCLDLDSGELTHLGQLRLKWPAALRQIGSERGFPGPPCGEHLVMAHSDLTRPRAEPTAVVLWLVKPDGTVVRRLTSYEMVIEEPGGGR